MVPETPAQRPRAAAYSAKTQMLRREDCQNENCCLERALYCIDSPFLKSSIG